MCWKIGSFNEVETGLELTTIQIIWSWDKSIATIPRHSSISPASIWKGFKPSNLRSVADLVANEEPVFIYIFQDTFSVFSFRGSVWRSLVIILKEILFVGPSPASFFFISSFLQTVNYCCRWMDSSLGPHDSIALTTVPQPLPLKERNRPTWYLGKFVWSSTLGHSFLFSYHILLQEFPFMIGS